MNRIIFPLKPDMQGEAVTDLQDGLRLLLDQGFFQLNNAERQAFEEGLRIERARKIYGEATARLVGLLQERLDLESCGTMDEPTANALNRLLAEYSAAGDETTASPAYQVTGTVRLADGYPAGGVTVAAFDRDLRTEQLLGEAQTDRNGAYSIEYSERQFLNQEGGTADLVVKALAADGSILIASPVLFNAPENAEIDLTIPLERQLPPTLFERIESAVQPLLGRVTVEQLEENQEHQDLTFLSGEAGFEKSALARFVLTHHLLHLGIEREFWFALLGASFFEYAEKESLKENMAVVMAALPALDARAMRKALASSFNRREIPAPLQKRTDEWTEAFLELVARLVLGDAESPTFVRMALEHAGIVSADKQAKFARLFNQHRTLTPELLVALDKDRSFKKAEIADLRTSYQLAELTRGDFSVVKMLKEEFNIRRPEQIRALAKHSEREWVELIERKHKAGDIKLPLGLSEPAGPVQLPEVEIYAKTLERQFREAFPTAAFAGGLERALSSGGARGIRHAESLGRIIERHPEFDLLRTPVDEFLNKGIRAEFRGLAKDETFRLELKAVQRVFKLTPTFEATDELQADGLHSAQMIYRIGESEFVRRYTDRPGFSADSARLAWNRAADTHAAVLTIIGDLAEFDSGILPGVLRSSHPDLKLFPNWENLFQSGDICHCEHCRSVLSPAAYFADLLMFLRYRNSTIPNPLGGFDSALDILFKRRPDLGYLELNCENALTSLPYVDVVCEVLERVVADKASDVELVGFNAIPAGAAAGKAAVAAALSANKINVGTDFTLSQVDPNYWVVHGDDATYLLKKEGTPNFFAQLIPNTKASSEELRAYPAYVNSEAYKTLKAERSPLTIPLDLFDESDSRRAEQRARSFSLPFDLFAEEVRAGFQKSNLQRWDLMRTFKGPAAPNNPTDAEIAAEYLGISCGAAPSDEKSLIFNEDKTAAGQQAVWGETGNGNWLDLDVYDKNNQVVKNSLCVVKYFLKKTGLEYNELLALLDLPFINPAGDITIEHRDSSCDTDQKLIHGFIPAKLDRLDRIHRFLRLWRKLSGWKMWELDLVVRCKGIAHQDAQGEWLIDDTVFLVNLYYLSRLRNRLGAKTTVEELCGLFSKLNTETHFTRPHEKRADGLYQSLFLNRKLIQPLDRAFEIDPVKHDIKLAFDPITEQPILDPITGLQVSSKIKDHHAAFQAVLGIKEDDLIIVKTLTRASDGAVYINDDLTLDNVSFLWRHAWLAKRLKFKVDEWKTVLKLLQQDVTIFADPKAAFEFVERVDHLKATGFTPDELNWLLAADRSAKAAVKEADAARFLTTLRKDLQAIKDEYDPNQYAYLSPPRDVENLDTLLTSILRKLNRSETETQVFLKVLRGPVVLEADVQGLGPGFAFPPAIIGAPNYIPIRLEWILRFNETMTPAQKNTLLTDPSLAAVTALPSYIQAIQDLFEQSGQATVIGLPAGFTFPAVITGKPNNIPIRSQVVLRFNGVMTDAQRTVLKNVAIPGAVTAKIAYDNAIEDLFRQSAAAGDTFLTTEVASALPVVNLPANYPSIPIQYNATTKKLSFMGVMSNAECGALKTAGNNQDEIEALFWLPRLAVKFFEPVFAAQLKALPSAVDFKVQLPADLAEKISYDTEQKLLRFTRFMSKAEQSSLDKLVPPLPAEPEYHLAVNALYNQPRAIVPPDDRIWLMDNEIDPTLPTYSTLAKRLANAALKGLHYLSGTLTAKHVVDQCSAQLGLTASVTRHLLDDFRVMPPVPPALEKDSLLIHLTRDFAPTGRVIEYTSPTMKPTFDGWFWANRAAAILKKWKLTPDEFDFIIHLTVGAQLLDMLALPLADTDPLAPVERFTRTSRLLRIRDALPEEKTTFLDVLQKLDSGVYAALAAKNPATTEQKEFARDVALLNEAWLAVDMEVLIASLDLAFHGDYLLAENWERIRRAFSFLENLNASAETAKTFAAASMTDTHAKTLKALLRSKFGGDTWLTLSAEIQDALRERKRDALTAYLLAGYLMKHPNQANVAPSRKWENTNDLYAYYLLDVEMGAFQLTSRLVQASGSVQLFVQRCFMGIEPDVKVQADEQDGDSAWRWWKWMSKYRVWEANRKVFLWPENWIEPELKKDRSYFFKELENELLQNEINQYTAETAFANYLEKLEGVAQLEIAGFYQEDDGDNTIVHVFGRTPGVDPHLYYYRRYDYRQWTPWEKVDLDIQGDYLVPAVINKRLFLFWPVFTEVPDEAENSKVELPDVIGGSTLKAPDPNTKDQKFVGQPAKTVQVKKAKKKLRLQMAVSDYRQGKWTPKRVSTQYDDSKSYDVEIIRKRYTFRAVDRSAIDGRFGVVYEGYSVYIDENGTEQPQAHLSGAFDIFGCKGIPELDKSLSGSFIPTVQPEEASTHYLITFLKYEELKPYERDDYPNDDFTLKSAFSSYLIYVLNKTPDLFKMTPPWHLSYLDKFLLDGPVNPSTIITYMLALPARMPMGTWLPFFYNDKKRTFFVLPALPVGGGVGNPDDPKLVEEIWLYYPAIKWVFHMLESFYGGQVQAAAKSFVAGLNAAQRQDLGKWLCTQIPGQKQPPSTEDELRDLLVQFLMRYVYNFLGGQLTKHFHKCWYQFKNFYHPFVCEFSRLIYNPMQGVPGLMKRETQLKNSGFHFPTTYQPPLVVIGPLGKEFYPEEIVDFSPDGAYSPYNWELFFHAPLLIANTLSKNQRFEEARDWYHFIFNPIGVESPVSGGPTMSKYWITKPFFETTDPQYVQQRIENLLRMLAGDTTVAGYSPAAKMALEGQVLDWRTNPFEPHRIANYRTVAYQKTVVMKYLDNLIAWGDYLFRQDSMESIYEATQLYILAAEILGPRPKKIPPQVKPPVESFNELKNQLDAFSNALVQVENLVPMQPGTGQNGMNTAPLPMLYFCIPHNEKMLSYWDTAADRLYKIRHGMNIEGVLRQLALFEPPIEPGALVKAIAAGVDISAALADLNAPLPLYRFNVLLQKANEVCSDVKALGAALLSAIEKKDGEALSLLRQSQEIRVLEAVKAIREKQIEEAKENLAGAKKSKELAETKMKYYKTRDFMNPEENAALNLNIASNAIDAGITAGYIAASIISLIPMFSGGGSGFGGSPVATMEMGGQSEGQSAELYMKTLEVTASSLSKIASTVNTMGSYTRRQDEWIFQWNLALKEMEQLDKQIAAAELRLAIAEKELENHVTQIENAKAIDAFMRSKYTNEELYQWQVGQISGVYFQNYKLAYDLAKRAERCMRFELGPQDSSFISFGYWDSLKKGLLSGEKLQYDLRRIESAYLDQNRREFELTKHISLVQLDPLALVRLRETGRCFFRLPEELFDLDYPGHYFRRIKSVSLTLPCVAGPYTTTSCTLRLLKNSIRINTTNGDSGYPRNTDEAGLPADDTRFIENNIPVKAIAASSGQNDSGVFELSFRDERYLPFEGAGAISEWSLELFSDLPANNPDPAKPPDFGRSLRQFDYRTISDIILHIKYTAREDAGVFKNGAIAHLRDYFSQDGATPSLRMFNLRQEFPTQWHRFLNPTNPADGNVFELEMAPSLFPIRDVGETLKVNTIWLLARCADVGNYEVVMVPPLPAPPLPGVDTLTLAPVNQYGGLHFAQKDVAALGIEIVPTDPPVKWQLKMTRPGGKVIEVEDILLVLGYEYEWK